MDILATFDVVSTSSPFNSHLSADVVHEPVHAGLHAERVLAWQQLGVAVAVETDRARQELLELLHGSVNTQDLVTPPPFNENRTHHVSAGKHKIN